VGAIFGGVTLIGFFIFAFIAGTGYANFICSTFQLLAAVFAFGAALAVTFMGGGAAARGQFGNQAQSYALVFGLGGGAAFFVITFIMFSIFRPECKTLPEHTLLFDDIPLDFKLKSGDKFWTKETLDASTRSVRLRGEVEGLGQLRLVDGSNAASEDCTFTLHMLDEIEDKKFLDRVQRNYDIATQPFSGNSFTFTFNKVWHDNRKAGEKNAVRALKADEQTCFRSFYDEPIGKTIGVNLKKSIIYYATGTKGPIDPRILERPTVRDESLRTQKSGFWGFAQASAGIRNKQLPYAEVRSLLSAADIDVRINARQHLEENFLEYANFVMEDVFRPNLDPNYLTGLLYGIIAGVDVVTDGALAPGQPRNLSESPKFIRGNEKSFIDLTGHPADPVRKQARRLIQRYPTIPYEKDYEALAKTVARNGCANIDVKAIVYGAIFYYYNRIIQYSFEPTMSTASAEAVERLARQGRAMSICLDEQLRIDAASLTYAKAFTFSRFATHEETGRTYAKEFLEEAGKRYYAPLHVESAKVIRDKR